MNKKFLICFLLAKIFIVDTYATDFSDAGWFAKENGILRSIIVTIDNDIFDGKLNQYITHVSFAHGGTEEENVVAKAFPYLEENKQRKVFIVVNTDSIDLQTITFDTMYRMMIHEMCHAARYIFDNDLGLGDSHGGNFMKWVNYAKARSTIIKNPELITFIKGVGGIK